MLSMFGTSFNISSSAVDAKQILDSRQFLRCRKCLCKSRQGPVWACAGSRRARAGWMIGEDLACSTMFGPITGQDPPPLTNQRPEWLTLEFFSVSLQQSGLCQAGGKNCISLYCAMWDGERINLLGYFEFQHSIYFWNSLRSNFDPTANFAKN